MRTVGGLAQDPGCDERRARAAGHASVGGRRSCQCACPSLSNRAIGGRRRQGCSNRVREAVTRAPSHRLSPTSELEGLLNATRDAPLISTGHIPPRREPARRPAPGRSHTGDRCRARRRRGAELSQVEPCVYDVGAVHGRETKHAITCRAPRRGKYYFQTMRRRLDIKHVRDGVMQQLCALYSRIYHNRRGTKSPGDGFLARPSLCSRITRLRCWGIGGGCTDRAWVMRQ